MAAVLLLFRVPPVSASLQCNGCHGTSNPSDIRPVDDSFRNPSTGGFVGKHRTHAAAGATPAACVKCHPGSDRFASTHRSGLIKVSSNINTSPLRAVYNNSTSVWPQTPLPVPGVCTNVNCHFEATTPAWGSAVFSSISQCSQCHGAPAALTKSHATHSRYSSPLMGKFSTFAACATCHVDYASALNFQHATSAGKHPINVTVGGYDSGSTTYLPSQSHGAFGTCTNLYCHSPGNKSTNFDPPNQAATWGGSLSCNGCHKDGAGDPMVSGSHPVHLLRGYGCVVCHAGTVSDNTTIKDTTKHATGSPSIAFSGSYSAMVYNGEAKSCSGACHSDGRSGAPNYLPVWGTPNSHGCGFCHAMPPETGAHSKHMPSPANYSLLHQSYTSAGVWSTATDYAFGCANCHPNDAAFHVNGSVDLSLDNTGGGVLKGNNRVSTPNSGYTQTKGVSVVCSAAYCHGGYTYIFNYTSYEDPVTAIITNTTPASPDWYASYTGDRCAMCHGNPPTGYTWHSGNHGGQDPTGTRNQCQFCHTDATSPNNGIGTAITNKALHVNGSIDMSAVFVNACFGCH